MAPGAITSASSSPVDAACRAGLENDRLLGYCWVCEFFYALDHFCNRALSRAPPLLPLRRSLGPNERIPAYAGTSGWLAMLDLSRRSGSRSPCSGFQTAWQPSSAWPPPNSSSASSEPSPASEKLASPSGFSCLLCLIAPYIHAPFALFPFHPSISLRADLLPLSGELTGNPENRLEYFGELIAHVVGLAVSSWKLRLSATHPLATKCRLGPPPARAAARCPSRGPGDASRMTPLAPEHLFTMGVVFWGGRTRPCTALPSISVAGQGGKRSL
jgi:hypothetical protein